jgi:hypothetical protein
MTDKNGMDQPTLEDLIHQFVYAGSGAALGVKRVIVRLKKKIFNGI